MSLIATPVAYDSIAAATAAHIPAGYSSIQITGGATPGDGLGGLYIPCSASVGKFQSADGQWWQSAPASPAEAAVGVNVTQGTFPATAGAGSAQAGNSYLVNAPFTNAGTLTEISLYCSAAGTVTLLVASIAGGVATLQASQSVSVVAGVNTFTTWNPTVSAGWYLGIYSAASIVEYAASGPGDYYSAAGLIGSSTAVTFGANQQIQIGWILQSGLQADVRTLQVDAQTASQTSAATNAIVGTTVTQGLFPATVGTGIATGGNTYFSNIPLSASGTLTEASIYSAGAGPATIVIASIVANVATLQTSKVVNLVAGQNTLTGLNLSVTQGWFFGVYDAAGLVGYDINGQYVGVYSCTGIPGASTSVTFTATNPSMRQGWQIQTGLQGAVASLQSAPETQALKAGIGLLASADPTGAADATSTFASALAAYPSPQVPVANPNYAVTDMPNDGEGFYGTGPVLANGVTVSLPVAPERGSRWLKLRATLVSQIYSGSCLIINGDSITNGAYASVFEKSYVGLLTRFANMGVALDEAVFVNFDTTDPSGGPSFEGITFASPTTVTNGTNGPVSKSLLLAAGQSMSFAGAYSQIDVTYTGVASGVLAFAFNGAAAFKTVNTASSGSDIYTGPSATGQTASGTYTITNTGAVAVEITSLIRLGVLVAGAPPRLHVCRFAHGGYAFSSYGSAQVASMMRIAGVFGGTNHFLIPALGTNDEVGNGLSYASMKAAVTTYLSSWTAAGIPVTSILPIMPWRWSYYASGGTFEQGNAGIRDAFIAAGVTRFVKTDGLDMIAWGLSPGDGHPNDAGHLAEFNAVVDALVM